MAKVEVEPGPEPGPGSHHEAQSAPDTPHSRILPTDVLEDVERRRNRLWAIAAILLVGASVAVVVLFSGLGLDFSLTDNPVMRWSFLLVSLAFVLYVIEQERTLRQLAREAIERRASEASLQTRVQELTGLLRVARTVNSVLRPEEVFDVILSEAMELANANGGAVAVLEKEQLVITASAGIDAVPVGTVLDRDVANVRLALEASQPVVAVGVPWAAPDPAVDGSVVLAPLSASGRRVGVLTVERSVDVAPFDETDVKTVGLFAEHAATAVNNSRNFGRERSAVERLVAASAYRSEFVAKMVHDLRSPLSAIVGYSSLLDSDAIKDSDRDRALTTIRMQAQRLERMTAEILKASSAEAGAELRRQPVSMETILEDVRDLAFGVVTAREQETRELVVRGAEDVPVIWGDAEALRQIFTNLIENALKYSPAGTPVDVDVEQIDGEVVVHVHDRGRGIDPKKIGRVFDRFNQEAFPGDGVGLGLYIVRTLVAAHGGRVWAVSREGEGSTFSVALPMRARDKRGTNGQSAHDPAHVSAGLG